MITLYRSRLQPYILIADQKAAGTSGGTFTSGADRTRVLNTIVFDTHSIASLSSNQFTIPAGTYIYEISAPAYQVDRHQALLYNITDAAIAQIGTTEFSLNAAGGVTTCSRVEGIMTITSSKAFEVRHRCQTTSTTFGFGVESNFSRTETYTTVKLIKIA